MTDSLTADEHTELGGRGRLVIKERAVARVAVTAAASVDGVTRTRGGITSRELPRAEVSIGEESVAVNLYIGVLWPSRISEVAAAVHDSVADSLHSIIGLPLHHINVLVKGTTAVDEPGVDTDTVPLPCRPPTAGPAVLPVALVLAVGALGAAFALGREFLIGNGTIGGAPWIENTVDAIAQLGWEPWMFGASIAAVVIGVLLTVLALKPRARTHTAIATPDAGSPTVWMRPTDLARISSEAAHSVPGVASARTTVTRRSITIDVHRTATADPVALESSVRTRLAGTSRIAGDHRKLKIRVAEERS